MSDQALAIMEPARTAQEITQQVQRIQEVMKAVMKNGVHFGTIPGCGDKPALLKPGAEKLMMTFRLAVDPEVVNLSDLQTVRYRVLARITSQSTSVFLGLGVGECSSDEEKYAWRRAACKEEWDAADPANRREKWMRGKQNSAYHIQQVRTNPSDVANTVLKMAKKRALVDGVLTVTGASDIFSQDLDELEEGHAEASEVPADPNEAKLQAAKAEKPATPADVPVLGFVKFKGKRLDDDEIPVDYLTWLATDYDEKLKDPKNKYKERNQTMRAAVERELVRRGQPGGGATEEHPDLDQGEDAGPSASTTPDPLDDDQAWSQLVDELEGKPEVFKATKAKLEVTMARELRGADRRAFFTSYRQIEAEQSKKKA